MSVPRGAPRPERRATRRADLHLAVKVWRSDGTVELRSKNIGVGGMRLVFGAAEPTPPFAVGESVDLDFELPMLGDRVVTKGEVRWVADGTCGIQFTALHPRVVSAINRLHASVGV